VMGPEGIRLLGSNYLHDDELVLIDGQIWGKRLLDIVNLALAGMLENQRAASVGSVESCLLMHVTPKSCILLHERTTPGQCSWSLLIP
jgi:hypothetical protein